MRLIKALARFVAVVYDGQVCDEQRLECRWDKREGKGGGRENDAPQADVRGEKRSVRAGLATCGSEGWGTIDGKRRERRCETGRRDFRRV